MRECPNCKEVFGTYRIRHNTSDRPVEEAMEPKYCPCCGTMLEGNAMLDDGIYITESNLYDKVHRYINCVVEVLENSVTGETSVGWYETDETEEIFDWEY